MFALDLSAKCCYQSHRLSQGIPICSKWKSSEREKHKRIKKAKFKCNRNVTLPLVSDIECLYHQLSFPSPSSRKAFKSPSFIPPWYRALLKSLGKKSPAWRTAPVCNFGRRWVEHCVSTDCSSGFAYFPTLGSCGCLSPEHLLLCCET